MERHRHHDEPGDEHRNDEHIVELACLPSTFEADVLVAALKANGIKAMAAHGDAAGWYPQYAKMDGHRVMVFESDLDAAREITAQSIGEGS